MGLGGGGAQTVSSQLIGFQLAKSLPPPHPCPPPQYSRPCAPPAPPPYAKRSYACGNTIVYACNTGLKEGIKEEERGTFCCLIVCARRSSGIRYALKSSSLFFDFCFV